MISKDFIKIFTVVIFCLFLYCIYIQNNKKINIHIKNHDNNYHIKQDKQPRVHFNNNVEKRYYNIPSESIINSETSDKPDTWDKYFDQPLINKRASSEYNRKIIQQNKDYNNSMDSFSQHITDNDVLIENDVTIQSALSSKNRGRKISDIYDELTQTPKAKPKKIKYITDTETVYDENDPFMSFNSSVQYKNAQFGDEFIPPHF